MQKIVFILAIITLVIAPSAAWAHPGPLDQYGGHVCVKNYAQWGLADGEYHYHDYPNSPSYMKGSIIRPMGSHLFYLPNIAANELTASQVSFTQFEINELTKNSEIDKRFCNNSQVFAPGLYDSLNRARVKPVCMDSANVIESNTDIPGSSYYQEIPDVTAEINNVYHVIILKDGRKVFTDMPAISELKGKIVKGLTDSVLYYVNRYDDPLTLRPITEDKAIFYGGADYANLILYFDDSIIYSYKIGKPLN